MSEVWFTADTHFSHQGILGLAHRFFPDVQSMNERMISLWNEYIGKHDIVYHLGDVSFAKTQETNRILYALNGRIRLIRGNHDKNIKGAVADRFEWIKDLYDLRLDSKRIVLCHYPFDTWNKCHRGGWHLHGHSHGSLKTVRGCRMDVGVDTNALRPYHWDEILEKLNKQRYSPVDHHEPK